MITLNRLPHGKYNLVIRKKNGFGINNYSYKKLVFIVMPKFYETVWFAALLLSVFILITLLLYQLRHGSLLKQKQLLEINVRERTVALSESVQELNSTVGKLNLAIDKLNESEQKLSEANKVKEQTIAIILHDIKTPLQYLNMVATDLKNELIDITKNELEDFSDVFVETITKTNAFVEDLLQWLLSQQEGFKPNYSRFSILNLYVEIEMLYGDVVKSRLNKLSFGISDNNMMLFSDRDMLKLIIRNLVDNANKHTLGGVIELLADIDNKSVWLIVKDNGRGMTAEQLERINTLASDVNIFRDSKFGLSLISKFINLIKGTMVVQNIPTGGTMITLKFTLEP